jgi:hypothetical protein
VLRKNKWLKAPWRDLALRESRAVSTSAHSFPIKLNAAESVRSWAHFASFLNCSLHEKGRAAIHHWALLLLPRANADSYLTGHAPALTPFTVMVPIQPPSECCPCNFAAAAVYVVAYKAPTDTAIQLSSPTNFPR